MGNVSKTTALSNLLHIARKAGKVKAGMEASCNSCLKKNADLILCAIDMSRNSKERILRIAGEQGIKVIIYGNKQLYSDLFQRTVTGILSVEDKNFAAGIIKILS